MNQILFCNDKIFLNQYKSKNFKKYKFIFIFSLICFFIFSFTLIFLFYTKVNNINKSKKLLYNFNLKTLYSESNSYSTIPIFNYYESPFVIGIIEINNLDLCYPILSTTSEELLELSVCRFYGPMPNEIGNLCLAGHNYSNNMMFGKLNQLKEDDIIRIYDLSGNYLEYNLIEKKEVLPTDLSCTFQETNNKRFVTLITCNTFNKKRVVYLCSQTNKE